MRVNLAVLLWNVMRASHVGVVAGIFVVHLRLLSSDSGSIRSITWAEVGWGSVLWKSVGFLGGIGILWLALPKLAAWRAGSVSVIWTWSECLLLLVRAVEGELEESGDEEEEAVVC